MPVKCYCIFNVIQLRVLLLPQTQVCFFLLLLVLFYSISFFKFCLYCQFVISKVIVLILSTFSFYIFRYVLQLISNISNIRLKFSISFSFKTQMRLVVNDHKNYSVVQNQNVSPSFHSFGFKHKLHWIWSYALSESCKTLKTFSILDENSW